MQPLYNNIYLIPIPEEQKASAGLSAASSRFKKARVVFAGQGLPGRVISVKEGDKILYESGVEKPFPFNEFTNGFFLREEEITSIL